MNALREILANENVDIAAVDDNDRTKNTKLDKEHFKKKMELHEQMAKIGKQLDGLTITERMNWMTYKKEEGNILYQKRNFVEAIKLYMDALTGLKIEEDAGNIERSKIRKEYQIPISLNIAMCTLEQGKPDAAKKVVDNAIMLDPDYYKGYWKLGVIYERTMDFDFAMDNMDMALKLCDLEQDRDKIVARRNVILTKKKKYVIKSNDMYANMFSNGFYEEKSDGYVESLEKKAEKVEQVQARKEARKAAELGWWNRSMDWLWGLCGRKSASSEAEDLRKGESSDLKAKVKSMSENDQMDMLKDMAKNGAGRDAIVSNMKEMCDQVKELRQKKEK